MFDFTPLSKKLKFNRHYRWLKVLVFLRFLTSCSHDSTLRPKVKCIPKIKVKCIYILKIKIQDWEILVKWENLEVTHKNKYFNLLKIYKTTKIKKKFFSKMIIIMNGGSKYLKALSFKMRTNVQFLTTHYKFFIIYWDRLSFFTLKIWPKKIKTNRQTIQVHNYLENAVLKL